jgi:hypothetical protein
MFQAWRFKLREAQIALDQGRLEEAGRILTTDDLPTYLPAQQMLALVNNRLAKRSAEQAEAGDFATAWRDLELARLRGGETSDWLVGQKQVVELALADVVRHLQASDFVGAISRIDSLEKRQVGGGVLQTLREVTRRLDSAHKLSQRGKFTEAEDQLNAAATLRPDLALIDEQKRTCTQRAERSRILSEQLHKALGLTDWSQVLSLATELLEIAPENRLGRDARKRAWAEVGATVGDSRRFGETQYWNGTPVADGGRARQTDAGDVAVLDQPRKPRFLLWIDAVGGYLVCLGDEIVVGQAAPNSQVDVAIQADISRRHIKIRREGEGYVIEPLADQVKVEGRPINSPALISDGDEIELGQGVRLRFRKPHVLSASARLEMVSRHRLHPFVDAALLMAESCVLGPKWQNHVVCRDWQGDVVLYRQDSQIFCRAMESLEIDGQLQEGRGKIRPNSRVAGSDFSFTLEPLA